MTENLPDPYEGEYVDAELVEGDIWESCTLHHTRHCLACFPHQPWHEQVDPVVEDLLIDYAAIQNQVFRDLFGSFEQMDKHTDELIEQERQARCRKQRGWITLWCFLLAFYAVLGAVDFISGFILPSLISGFLVVFSACMIGWNRKLLKELQRGRR